MKAMNEQAEKNETVTKSSCCSKEEKATCCEPEAKASCCGPAADESNAAAPAKCGCR